MTDDEIDALAWDKQGGLLPAIVQDADNGRVLMLGYMNREALAADPGQRPRDASTAAARQRLWTKGETSGHVLDLVAIDADCDRDTLLVQARPHGPTCHLGRAELLPGRRPANFLAELDALIASRERERPRGQLHHAPVRSRRAPHRPEGRRGGRGNRARGRGRRTTRPCWAKPPTSSIHLTVLLRARGLSVQDVIRVLAARHR